MNKRALLCGLAFLMAAASFSCGKTEPQTEISSSVTETTVSETARIGETTGTGGEESTEATTKKKNSSWSFGMMGYVKKSHQVTANINAKTLFTAFTTYMFDNQLVADTDIVYSNTAVCEMSSELKELIGDEKDYDFIIIFDSKNHMPETVLVPYYEKNNFVGSSVASDEYEGMKWSEALEKYGFTSGEYTEIKLKEDDSAYKPNLREEPQENTLDLSDPEMETAYECAIMIFTVDEYAYSDQEIVYFKHLKEDKFPDEDALQMSPHGDIEYVLVYDENGELLKSYAWNCDSDKRYVGDSECGWGQDDYASLGWDGLLEEFGLTEGRYSF